MKTVINIYRNHKLSVDNFISSLMQSIHQDYIANADSIFRKYRYIQLIYGVNESFHQTTPIICKKERDETHIGSDKSHYFAKLNFNDEGIFISNPYIHYRTGKASISVVRKIGEILYVFDINLVLLLEELSLIEFNGTHDKIKRSVYFLGSTLLALVAIALIVYGGYVFFALMFTLHEANFLHDIFKSIIAITLGLAIYDLAKQIFEHEVVFQSFHHSEDKQYKVLGKFLISIIIALSIETLMVVFKIALDDYSKMISAFYLLIGTTVMFIGLGYFYKTINEAGCKDEE